MDEPRIEGAKSRIEAALARIEAVEQRFRQPADGGRAAQRKLEIKVRGVLNDLDDLIAGLER